MRFPGRDAIVATAGESIARGSRSFAAASKLFDRATRERAWLLYAWCRRCDDIADGQDHGHGMTVVEDPQARLAEVRERTAAALAGDWVGDAAFDALRIVAQETGMPHRFAWDLIDGFALDADGWRPESEDDLLRYCYHVAGVVGCMMAVVMGVPPEDEAVLDRACDLGLAFQLANIARDIGEDAEAGRCYLPAAWLAEVGLTSANPLADRGALAILGTRLADRAEGYEVSARGGAAALPFRSAWAVLAAADIYGGIARKVRLRGAHAWDSRTTTSGGEKLAAIAKAWGAAYRRAPTPRPAGLWTRPR
ncbi:phytoene/squalene synthase family protein [Sphingomonas sp.]|uniref:phytoene/squalene synthase family protein n=1 Tax=Sphingomonas sp. TaxID=28214 RepID=UPI002FDB4FEB